METLRRAFSKEDKKKLHLRCKLDTRSQRERERREREERERDTHTHTIKVDRVVSWIDELLEGEVISKHGLPLYLVEKGLEPLLPLYQKLTVRVTKQLLGREGKGKPLNLDE